MGILNAIGISSLNMVLRAIVTLAILLAAVKIIKNIVSGLLEKSKLEANIKNIVKSALNMALWALCIIIEADALGISTTSLVAVLSVAALALSLSVQDIMSNIFSGIVILLAKTFRNGDYVDIGANSGVIDNVGLTHTAIHTLDNRVINIPNKDVAGASIINYSQEPLRRVDLTFETDYEDKTEDVKNAINEAIRMDEKIISDPAPFVRLSAFKSSTVEYTVRCWCRNSDYWDVYFGLNENVRDSFDRNNIHMSYDHLNVHMMK